MSEPAMRNSIRQISGDKMPDHPGLMFSKYNSAIDARGDYHEREQTTSRMTQQVALHKDLYQNAFRRWEKFLTEDDPWAIKKILSARDRLFIGLGNESVLEFGLNLHPVYGTPRIPGSSIKGVCASYASQVWSQADKNWEEGANLHSVLFGNPENLKLKHPASAGAVDFLDAWWSPSKTGPFNHEIINTHHPNYYGGDTGAAPADWDAPNPVKMLAVVGSFLFAVRGPVHWNEIAMTLLTEAISTWGIGGKTRAGYGRFENPDGGNGKNDDENKDELWSDVLITWNPGGGGIATIKRQDGKSAEIQGKNQTQELLPPNYHEQLFNKKKKKAKLKLVKVSLVGGKNYKVVSIE